MNTYSNPSELKITDMRFVDIDGAPKRCTILRIDTNQGISGFGEVFLQPAALQTTGELGGVIPQGVGAAVVGGQRRYLVG